MSKLWEKVLTIKSNGCLYNEDGVELADNVRPFYLKQALEKLEELARDGEPRSLLDGISCLNEHDYPVPVYKKGRCYGCWMKEQGGGE